jgi:hypothetical protein
LAGSTPTGCERRVLLEADTAAGATRRLARTIAETLRAAHSRALSRPPPRQPNREKPNRLLESGAHAREANGEAALLRQLIAAGNEDDVLDLISSM